MTVGLGGSVDGLGSHDVSNAAAASRHDRPARRAVIVALSAGRGPSSQEPVGASSAYRVLVAKLTVYMTSYEYRTTISEVRARVFASVGRPCASTTVVVSSLMNPEWMVEVEAVAGLKSET